MQDTERSILAYHPALPESTTRAEITIGSSGPRVRFFCASGAFELRGAGTYDGVGVE